MMLDRIVVSGASSMEDEALDTVPPGTPSPTYPGGGQHRFIPSPGPASCGPFTGGGDAASVHSAHSGHSHGSFGHHSQYSHASAPVGTVTSDQLVSLKRDREREGRCAECGAQTHEFCVDPATGARRKEPLTVAGEVHRGRCLLCHPIGGSVGGGGSIGAMHSPHPYPFQDHTDVPSVVSSLTGGTIGGSTNRSATMSRHSASGRHRPPPSSAYQRGSLNTVSSRSGAESVGSERSRRSRGADSAASSVLDDVLRSIESDNADLCDIIASMRRYPHSSRVQLAGCEKLWIQSWDDENSNAIGRVGGIPTISDAMRRHARNARLQQAGAGALQNLALNEYNRDVVAECGGVVAVVEAMQRHFDNSAVQQCGCAALGNVAADSADNSLTVAECGGVHAILAAVEAFPEDEGVLRSAYQALRVLGYNPAQALADAQGQSTDDGGGDKSDGDEEPEDEDMEQ